MANFNEMRDFFNEACCIFNDFCEIIPFGILKMYYGKANL